MAHVWYEWQLVPRSENFFRRDSWASSIWLRYWLQTSQARSWPLCNHHQMNSIVMPILSNIFDSSSENPNFLKTGLISREGTNQTTCTIWLITPSTQQKCTLLHVLYTLSHDLEFRRARWLWFGIIHPNIHWIQQLPNFQMGKKKLL